MSNPKAPPAEWMYEAVDEIVRFIMGYPGSHVPGEAAQHDMASIIQRHAPAPEPCPEPDCILDGKRHRHVKPLPVQVEPEASAPEERESSTQQCSVCKGAGTLSLWTNVQGAAFDSRRCFHCHGSGIVGGPSAPATASPTVEQAAAEMADYALRMLADLPEAERNRRLAAFVKACEALPDHPAAAPEAPAPASPTVADHAFKKCGHVPGDCSVPWACHYLIDPEDYRFCGLREGAHPAAAPEPLGHAFEPFGEQNGTCQLCHHEDLGLCHKPMEAHAPTASVQPAGLPHRNCAGHFLVVRQENVSTDYPSVDVYRCTGCGQESMQPDAVYSEVVERMAEPWRFEKPAVPEALQRAAEAAIREIRGFSAGYISSSGEGIIIRHVLAAKVCAEPEHAKLAQRLAEVYKEAGAQLLAQARDERDAAIKRAELNQAAVRQALEYLAERDRLRAEADQLKLKLAVAQRRLRDDRLEP